MWQKPQNEIQKLENQIYTLTNQLNKLRVDTVPTPVNNYSFKDLNGSVNLLDLFGNKDILFVVHNMGQGCSYCTTWADGINAFLPHLESKYSVVLLSKDDPETQRRFANDRGWCFRMASHGGTNYLKENDVCLSESEMTDGLNSPGIVCYIKKGEQIFKKNATTFGPGDQFCSIWNILSMAGHGEENFEPQYSYWKKST